jgi:hypothetical protein
MSQKTQLTDSQLKANRSAIHLFIAQATAKYGRGSVILLPEFEENTDGSWSPVASSNGIRVTNDSTFLRLGKQYMKQTSTGQEIAYMYTNKFGDTEEDVAAFLLYVDPNATVGSAVRGCRLVIHESLKPFSKTNPDRDIKWASQKDNLKCLKYVVDPVTAEVKSMPVYRTTRAFFADDNGEFPIHTPNMATGTGLPEPQRLAMLEAEIDKCAMKTAKDRFIAHDNEDELSDAAVKRFTVNNKAKADEAIKQAAMAKRLVELQGKKVLTAAEQMELKGLLPEQVEEVAEEVNDTVDETTDDDAPF